ncbi:hypothetical protein C8J56DRAFT_135754 [Mycena floridula]|nr:hypothetical protein C8J56DRAFT_135754 [Mycena floridula]
MGNHSRTPNPACLWHPCFIGPAKKILPYCRKSSISFSLSITKAYLWRDVEYVSVWFKALIGFEGQEYAFSLCCLFPDSISCKFRDAVTKAGKKLMVFTVNEPVHMMEMVRWGVHDTELLLAGSGWNFVVCMGETHVADR